MQIQKVEYKENTSLLEAVIAHDPSKTGKKPAICIFHAWAGRDAFVEQKAERLAELGYVGCALDLYGKGILGNGYEENKALMQPFMEDRTLLQKRVLAGFNMVKSLPFVDGQKIGAIGFCFGGLAALDLARSGADVKGVVSFHGLLRAPEGLKSHCKSKVLALHGHDDPMVRPEEVAHFQKEMTEANVDWQIHIYGGTMHAFTNPKVNNPQVGTVYSADADRRSFIAMSNFFSEVFSS
ncbi:MAG: dienelactone hydrolase family protein [Chlamydiae bacterium]|nr:dienelactone hydrolase family protein [Chlamydiota bacterium]